MKDDIRRKNDQISSLEKQITDSFMGSHEKISNLEDSQVSLVWKLLVED